MKLYVISQKVNNNWDTYDSAVVSAENEEDARLIHPSADYADDEWPKNISKDSTWALPKDVMVEYIGEAKEGIEKGVIVASFNAG